MAKLTYKQRTKLETKPSNFALPSTKKGERDRYPLVNAQGKPSRSHAANAKARATQMFEKGKLTASQRATVNRKANKVLAETAPKTKKNSPNKGMKKKKAKNNPTY